MNIRSTLIFAGVLLLLAVGSIAALMVETEPGQGIKAAGASLELALCIAPGMAYFVLLELLAATFRSFRRGKTFAVCRWLAVLAALEEAVFIIANLDTLLAKGFWGWIPSHAVVMFLGILWFCACPDRQRRLW